ncbi:MAG: PAS domain S-box protein [Candidatus Bathyarchaeia archaeon]
MKKGQTTTEIATENFLSLLNLIADPATVIDTKGNFLLMNCAFEKITGYKNAEKAGQNSLITDNLTSKDIELIKENRKNRLEGKEVAPYEISVTSGNEKRFFELNAKKINFFGQQALLVLFRDVTARKLVEQKLKHNSQRLAAIVNEKVKEIKDNAEKLRTVFDSSPDAISFIQLDGKLLDFNVGAMKLFGYSSKDEAKDLNIFSHVPEREQPRVKVAIQRIIETGIIKRERYTLTNKAGQEFPVEISSSPVKNADGQVIGLVANTKNISEQKKLEDALIASEEKFRAIATTLRNAVVLANEDDKIVYWNPSAERMFGYTEGEAIGKELTDLIVPPENRSGHKLMLKQLAQSNPNTQRTLEVRALRKDKTSFPVELSVTNLQLKEKKFAVGIMQDISNRKKVEEAIKQERDMLETVTENIDAGLAIISRDYKILWANKMLRQTKNESIQNRLCYTVFNSENSVCPDCGVLKIFDGLEPVNRHDFHFINKQGKQKCVELIVTPIKDKNGSIVAALELAIDVTEKRRLESQHSTRLERLVESRTRQLKETQEKLVKTERLAAIGELAAMVGHDLRNPLTGMKAATYYLKGKTKNDSNPKVKEMLDLICDCIDQSNKIINDLLEYSRIIKLELTQNDPSMFITYALSTMQVPKNIKIIRQVKAQELVKFDSTKLLRVFINLIKNAFDAMPKGGNLSIISKQTSKNWIVTFTDSGEGMSKETLQKLGTPLFTTKAKGMGFGIPICKRIVEAHGGRLLIDSTLGQGTTVTVKIPLNTEQAKSPQ